MNGVILTVAYGSLRKIWPGLANLAAFSHTFVPFTMSYVIAAISNSGGAPEQAYRKMQSAAACPERPFAGKLLHSTA